MQLAAGPITPLIFLAAMLMTLPTAICYAELNRAAPSAAAASAWLWTAAHPTAGFLAGLLMTTYFFMAAAAQPLMFALFFRDFLGLLHVTAPLQITLTLGILVASAPIAWICLRGAETSIKNTIRLMVVETSVVLALSGTILIAKSAEPHGINLAPFDWHHLKSLSGFWLAMILGVLAFCGFDVVSTAAEEARSPREHLPKAILLTVIGISIFWAVNAWVFTLSTPADVVSQITKQGLTAVTPIARAYWGWGELIVILTGFTGLTAVYISSMQGTSRIVFALARHGLMPEWLARLEGERKVPRNAVWVAIVSVVFSNLLSLYLLENGLDSFTWWANALVFFATFTFLSVNVACGLYFLRIARPSFRLFRHLIVPLVGVVANAYLLYAAFFSALWADNWRTGKSVVVACVVLFVVQLGAVTYVRVMKPHLLAQDTPFSAQ
jgi:APA family basic amino acid/polyamine antiporter